MNYIGSKKSLLKFLYTEINKIADKNCHIFADLFAGTGIVGSYFKQQGFQVIANDCQYYSYVLNRHYIGTCRELPFAGLTKEITRLNDITPAARKDFVCAYLNKLTGIAGFLYQNYCVGGSKNTVNPRQYFSDANGSRADAIRQKIAVWQKNKLISTDEYFFLLASLLESLDKHANTAAVYGAFLKKLKTSAAAALVLTPAALIPSSNRHEVYNEDANSLIAKINCDILYLDPPYNQRQYAANYHLLETVARYDQPVISGRTGLRNYEREKSLYCSRHSVKAVFQDLILRAQARYIFLSYNNEGLMTHDDIAAIMSLRGKYGYCRQEYNRFQADTAANRNYSAGKTTEYLHYVICTRK